MNTTHTTAVGQSIGLRSTRLPSLFQSQRGFLDGPPVAGIMKLPAELCSLIIERFGIQPFPVANLPRLI